jgi:hypothetical protein
MAICVYGFVLSMAEQIKFTYFIVTNDFMEFHYEKLDGCAGQGLVKLFRVSFDSFFFCASIHKERY